MQADFEFLSSVVTVVWFVAFVALCVWAWSARRQRDFAAAARLPLEEDADACASANEGSD